MGKKNKKSKNQKIKKIKNQKMSIIPGFQIFVDKFNNKNVSCDSFFFLTHAHLDHMVNLKPFCGVVYCSKQTRALMKKMRGFERVSTKVLAIDEWVELGFGKVKAFLVTHCVGAVALLFCLYDGRNVLHTGDFRGHSSFPEYLDSKCDDVQFSKVLYDNTFGGNPKRFQNFPSVKESARLVSEAVAGCKIENPQIHIQYNGKIGIEQLALHLRKKKKIHYPYLSKFMPQLFCSSADDADIHINKCGCVFSQDKLVKIYLSARAFPEKETFLEVQGNNTFRICYSMHSSSNELAEFLMWVKKNEIEGGCEIVELKKTDLF